MSCFLIVFSLWYLFVTLTWTYLNSCLVCVGAFFSLANVLPSLILQQPGSKQKQKQARKKWTSQYSTMLSSDNNNYYYYYCYYWSMGTIYTLFFLWNYAWNVQLLSSHVDARTRVNLPEIPGDPLSIYINANFIKVRHICLIIIKD